MEGCAGSSALLHQSGLQQRGKYSAAAEVMKGQEKQKQKVGAWVRESESCGMAGQDWMTM